MPNFPVLDAHVHFYDPSRVDYPWLASVPAISGAFLPAQFDEARGRVEVEGIVFVEVDVAPGREEDEVAFVRDLAQGDARIRGIVASAPVEQGARVAEHLARLQGGGLVRGIRRLIQGHADPAYCLSPNFVEGVREVGRAGFTFDLCIRHGQFASAVELVRRCPEVEFVLDHIAKPPIADGAREPWGHTMREMAALPNVVVKISGVVTEADHARWSLEDVRPYIEHTAECFGFSRCLFGSDWPVVNLASNYEAWVDCLDTCFAGVPEADLRRFYRDNAVRTYSLARS